MPQPRNWTKVAERRALRRAQLRNRTLRNWTNTGLKKKAALLEEMVRPNPTPTPNPYPDPNPTPTPTRQPSTLPLKPYPYPSPGGGEQLGERHGAIGAIQQH